MCIRDRAKRGYKYPAYATGIGKALLSGKTEKDIKTLYPVSYTHLDVYKRQIMSNIQKQHKISPAIAWLTIQKFIIFYCPLDGEHTTPP